MSINFQEGAIPFQIDELLICQLISEDFKWGCRNSKKAKIWVSRGIGSRIVCPNNLYLADCVLLYKRTKMKEVSFPMSIRNLNPAAFETTLARHLLLFKLQTKVDQWFLMISSKKSETTQNQFFWKERHFNRGNMEKALEFFKLFPITEGYVAWVRSKRMLKQDLSHFECDFKWNLKSLRWSQFRPGNVSQNLCFRGCNQVDALMEEYLSKHMHPWSAHLTILTTLHWALATPTFKWICVACKYSRGTYTPPFILSCVAYF